MSSIRKRKEALYAVDLAGAEWRKSSFSAGESDCVEVAALPGGIAVRDSKNTGLPALRYTATGWAAFCSGVVAGDL
ncbi:DUF397 domain-containing protein [Streptomyces jumonjinensis]|uniref:DUF397 domain-containing protein n=1 Tax=Streptomyces jumonjinensis TaxID=1945 RepID=A0A646KKG7_STRJU|nr:DUF397 domain-containing protein [Streptomyces jumonjinensis]MQT02560.1 DUF397 domain-containing protein [Streptomyces jumonjinensis]